METISKENLSPKVFGYVPDDNPPVDAVILICGIGGNLSLPNGLFPFRVPYIFPSGILAIVFATIHHFPQHDLFSFQNAGGPGLINASLRKVVQWGLVAKTTINPLVMPLSS